MKIAISGASGFVGSHLSEVCKRRGDEIVPLGRDLFLDGHQARLDEAIMGCDVVINLAGAPINHRWSKDYKRQMYDSRIGVTHKLVSAINSLDKKPELFISTSAVGYYPSRGCFDEYNSRPGDSFLSKLCVAWEQEAQHISSEVRLVNTRFAVILSPDAGAFPQMVKPARLGFATIIGNGLQHFPWISLEDHGRAIEQIINSPGITGVVNLVAPDPINNKDFTLAVAKHFKSFVRIQIPQFIFSLLMGESAQLLTQGQCVMATKLIRSGFEFKHNKIEDFISSI